MVEIEKIFLLPPMAVARLGGSELPLASFRWVEDPSLYGAGLTVIEPAVTLDVLADGSVRPFMPAAIQFLDSGKFRPVAPFLELWTRIEGQDSPLTLKWLQAHQAGLANISYTVFAANRKAARRTGDPECAFSAKVTVRGDDHTRHELLASSAGENPLVFSAQPIPLGSFQVIRPKGAVAMGVDLGTLRVRFTPATGEVYGPPSATFAPETDLTRPHDHELVPPEHRILNPNASWVHYTSDDRADNPEPADTYDGADDGSRRNRSFGVVDDTCDVLIQASIEFEGKTWEATARIFSGPPDFAPDRRPFYSLAEELVDRDPPLQEAKEDLQAAIARVGDLFQRVYETASLANLDMMRTAMMPRDDRRLVNFPHMPSVTRGKSMKPADPAFDKNNDLNSPPSSHEHLPYTSVAAQTHAPLADSDDVTLLLRTKADRVRQLVRPAYGHFKDLDQKVNLDGKPNPEQRDPRNLRDTEFDMRMPPYMRDSDATPLSLNRRQYELLMQTLDRLQTKPGKAGGAGEDLTPTQSHVSRVVERRASKSAASARKKASDGKANPGKKKKEK